MANADDHVTDPVSLVGIDPLDTVAVRQILASVARNDLVVIEQLEELDASAQVQVKIHAANPLAVASAKEALANPTLPPETSAVATVPTDLSERGVRDVRDAYVAALNAPAREGDDSVTVTPDAGSRRHPRWSCEGCDDCVSEVPPA